MFGFRSTARCTVLRSSPRNASSSVIEALGLEQALVIGGKTAFTEQGIADPTAQVSLMATGQFTEGMVIGVSGWILLQYDGWRFHDEQLTSICCAQSGGCAA